MTAITAQFRGREELIQRDEIPPVPSSLVLKLPDDFGEGRVAEMFGEFAILEHPGDIQSFDIDGLVLADCRSREFVNVVSANVSNLRVLFGDLNSLFVAIIRASDLARKSALFKAKSPCRTASRLQTRVETPNAWRCRIGPLTLLFSLNWPMSRYCRLAGFTMTYVSPMSVRIAQNGRGQVDGPCLDHDYDALYACERFRQARRHRENGGELFQKKLSQNCHK
jgi:hypothetical protein